MEVGIDVSGLFRSPWTGIQMYTDGLLTGLTQVRSDLGITAISPYHLSRTAVDEAVKDGNFQWLAVSGYSQKNRVSFAMPSEEFKVRPPFHKRYINRLDPRRATAKLARSYANSRIRGWNLSEFDIVHIPESGYSFYREYNLPPTVFTIYDIAPVLFPGAFPGNAAATWLEYFEFAKHRASRIIAISESTKNDLAHHLGFNISNIDVTPLAPRNTVRRVVSAEERLGVLNGFSLENRPFVLYAGTIEPRKNVDSLVCAFAGFLRKHPQDNTVLVLAGQHWPAQKERMNQLIDQVGLQDRVLQTGYVSNAVQNVLLSSCRTFAYISNYEGFGLPPLEAMTCGAPVIVSNRSSLPEVVGEAGIQVSPDNQDEIIHALELLVLNEEENTYQRQLSLARAANFSWAKTAELTERSYRAALKS